MKFKTVLLLFFLMASGMSIGQEKKSKGDILFFEYAYRQAIQQYQKEMRENPLTIQQQLNLADSYLKIGNYRNASEAYLQVYRKDSVMSAHHFNKMLQCMTRTSGTDRVKAFLATKTMALSDELLENTDFNFDLLGSNDDNATNFKTFNLNGNSPQSDFAPSFYNDQLLFTSARGQGSKKIYGPSGESYLDIFTAKVGNDGNILNPNPFTGIPNSPFHQATSYYSKELNTLFYIGSNADNDRLLFDENGKNTLAVGLADEQGTFRFVLRDLSISFYYPFYDAESGKLYFAANLEDGFGGTDIYYAHTNNGLLMSAPINLGPRINSPGNEIAPFIFENSFYFSSDIFYGLGGMDIYKSEMQDDGFFSIPINLGKGINSSEDEFSFIIKNYGENSLLGYFSSNREGGKGNDDIYGFIVKEKPGLKTFSIKGKVINPSSDRGISKAQIRLLDIEGNTIKEVYTSEDGDYRVEIPWREQITIESTKDRYSVFSVTYNEEEMEAVQKKSYDISIAFLDDLVEEKEDQTVMKLSKFFFARGKYTMTPEIALELDKVVEAVQKFPQLQLRIEAHTDSRGGSATNFRLSQRRADAIRKYLLDNGVPSSNILYTIGYGEDRIINNCKNGVYCLDMLHKKNERHLIVVLNYDLLY